MTKNNQYVVLPASQLKEILEAMTQMGIWMSHVPKDVYLPPMPVVDEDLVCKAIGDLRDAMIKSKVV